jgi:hypothetical protein
VTSFCCTNLSHPRIFQSKDANGSCTCDAKMLEKKQIKGSIVLEQAVTNDCTRLLFDAPSIILVIERKNDGSLSLFLSA